MVKEHLNRFGIAHTDYDELLLSVRCDECGGPAHNLLKLYLMIMLANPKKSESNTCWEESNVRDYANMTSWH